MQAIKPLLIVGPGRAGKDLAATYVVDYLNSQYPDMGYRHESSSWIMRHYVWRNGFNGQEGAYSTPKACWEDRRHYRDMWYKWICEYNRSDRTNVAAKIFEEPQSVIYCGIRAIDEYHAVRDRWPECFSVYIYRPVSDDPTLQIDRDKCDLTVYNTGTKKALRVKIEDYLIPKWLS